MVTKYTTFAIQVIVVDVEDRDDSVWHNLTPFDGGLSGWRLLWDRWCPIPQLRSTVFSFDIMTALTPKRIVLTSHFSCSDTHCRQIAVFGF